MFKPWPGQGHCVASLDKTLLSQYLFVEVYKWVLTNYMLTGEPSIQERINILLREALEILCQSLTLTLNFQSYTGLFWHVTWFTQAHVIPTTFT